MLRSVFLIFNILLTGVLYTLACSSGFKERAVMYTITNFSIPYIALNFAIATYCLIRWFIKQDHDMIDSGVTFLHNIWISGLLTFIAYELTCTNLLTKALEYARVHM